MLWFTGLFGSGKSTLSEAIAANLREHCRLEVLDGDVFRSAFSEPIVFSMAEQRRNVETAGLVARILSKNGISVISSFITPYHQDRVFLRKSIPSYIEVYLNTPLEICEKRDVKGLYKQARAGLIKNFTGIDDSYEAPSSPDLEINTEFTSVHESTKMIVAYLLNHGYLISST